MRPTILLFDIDGTLVTTGGAGRRAMQRGFQSVYGPSEALAFRFDGLTDRAIARRGIESLGAPAGDAEIDRVLEAYVAALAEEVARTPSESYRVHAGMREAVAAGHARGAAVGLGTGNVRSGARLKLERVDLFRHFGFGGFGCDAESRVELVRIGAERGAERLGAPLAECRVVVVGDTPKDVDAARGIGAESVGVGTGAYSAEALLEHGATAAFSNLSVDGALEALFGAE